MTTFPLTVLYSEMEEVGLWEEKVLPAVNFV